MQLSLNNIVPHHLRQRLAATPSGVWGHELMLEQGSAVFIQAPSGAGKTTLAHILYGLRHDYEGTVRWGDRNITTATDEQVAHLRANALSIVFQDMRLFNSLTAWENIAVKNSLANATTDEQVAAWMERLGIYLLKDAPAATLSFGEQQRVAIVRSLVQPFTWLLLDEPFSHLDNSNRSKAIDLIAEVVQLRRGGMILADLDTNNYFPYNRILLL